jgi:hypothetical protein
MGLRLGIRPAEPRSSHLSPELPGPAHGLYCSSRLLGGNVRPIVRSRVVNEAGDLVAGNLCRPPRAQRSADHQRQIPMRAPSGLLLGSSPPRTSARAARAAPAQHEPVRRRRQQSAPRVSITATFVAGLPGCIAEDCRSERLDYGRAQVSRRERQFGPSDVDVVVVIAAAWVTW